MKRLLFVCLSSAMLVACAPVHPAVQPDEVISRAAAAGSDAVVLSRSGWLLVENAARGPYTLEVKSRTRVLSESGARLRKLAVALPPGSELLEFDGRVVQANGTVLPAGKSAARMLNDKLVVDLPQAGVGSTIEYCYKVRCHQALDRLNFDFQSSVPVVKSYFTATWPKWARLHYELVNVPRGQSAEPDIRSGHGPGIPDFARISWRMADLEPVAPGNDRASIILGLKDEAYEKKLAQRETWGGAMPAMSGFHTIMGRTRFSSGIAGGLPPTVSSSHSGRPIAK